MCDIYKIMVPPTRFERVACPLEGDVHCECKDCFSI